MFQGNSGLKPKEGEVTSRPWQWPLNYKVQFYSIDNHTKMYLCNLKMKYYRDNFFLVIIIKFICSETQLYGGQI